MVDTDTAEVRTYEAYHPGLPVHAQTTLTLPNELPTESNFQAQNAALEELQAQNRDLLMRLTALEQNNVPATADTTTDVSGGPVPQVQANE